MKTLNTAAYIYMLRVAFNKPSPTGLGAIIENQGNAYVYVHIPVSSPHPADYK